MNLTIKRFLYRALGSKLVCNPVYRYLLNRQITSKANQPKLNVVMAENTNLCNLNCEFCFRKQMTRKQGIMDNDLLRRIVNQTDCDFSLQGLGEPLIDKDIFYKILLVKNKGLKLFLSTNGLLLDNLTGVRLASSKLDVLNISLDANSDETYSKIHCCPKGVFDKLIKQIERFLKIRNRHPKVELVFKCYESNKGEEKGFIKRWRGKASLLVALNIFKWYDTDFKDNIPKKIMRFPCWFLWNTLFINWDGTVPLCCHDYDCREQLGDVTKDKLQDIFNSPKLIRMRQQHLAGVYTSICKDCKVNSQYVNPEWWWR